MLYASYFEYSILEIFISDAKWWHFSCTLHHIFQRLGRNKCYFSANIGFELSYGLRRVLLEPEVWHVIFSHFRSSARAIDRTGVDWLVLEKICSAPNGHFLIMERLLIHLIRISAGPKMAVLLFKRAILFGTKTHHHHWAHYIDASCQYAKKWSELFEF